MHHPQFVQSPIVNDCLKVEIDGHTEPQLVPIFLLKVSVRELHNNIVSDVDNGGLKEARYEGDNIIISDSTLRSLLPPKETSRDEDDNIIISDYTLRSLFTPQLKKCCQDTRSCVVSNVAYMPKVYIPHYCHGEIFS